MLIKFPSGNKPDNDKLLLDQGFIVLDNESKGIRVHDGSTVGGFESVGFPPRSSEFLGEVPAGDLINGTDLAVLVGLTTGEIYENEGVWLKFYDEIDQKTKFIAKRPFRHNLSWDQLNAVGIVYGKEITIQGQQYICRLISRSFRNPYTGQNGYGQPETYGSEWNRLIYHVTLGHANDIFVDEPNAPGDWAQYTANELGLVPSSGRYTLCLDFANIEQTNVLLGDIYTISFVSTGTSKNTIQNNYTWRPLLELVE